MLEGVVRAQLQDGGAEDGPREEALAGGADPRLKRSVVDVIKPLRYYAVRLTPYATSGSVKLTCVITTLDGFLRP